MRTLFGSTVLAFTLAIGAPVFAEEAHHPPGSAQTQAQPTSPQVQPQRPGMGMMSQGMMGQGGMTGPGGMSGMMPMMGMMQMMHGGAHIDGRLAFIKAELKITSAQEKAWDDLATALRQAAAKVREATPAMHAMSGTAGSATPPQLLEQHEKQLTARLEAIRIVKPAVGPFYASLNEDQKKTLAQLHPMLHGIF